MAMSEKKILRETAYYKLDKLVWEMRQAKTGIQMKQQKSFFSTIRNACTGKELIQWIRSRLHIPDDSTALHLANMLCYLGYIIPVSERHTTVRLDTSCFRIQRPALWPSRKWDSSSEEYAVYLLKKTLKSKSLENYEQTALTNLGRVHANSWSKLKKQATDAVSKYGFGTKDDKEIEDSQERAFWRVHRPPPGNKPHHYSNDGMMKKSMCMEAIIMNKRSEVLQKKIEFMKLYLHKSLAHPEQVTGEKTINTLVNHCVRYKKHDPLLSDEESFLLNPWVAIDEYFYEDLLEFDQKKHTQLDVEAWALSFRELLKDKQGKKLFAAFLQQEYSCENLHFWEACEDVKQSPLSKIAVKVARIEREFLTPNAAHEVNLDREVLQTTLQAVRKLSHGCLDVAQQHIYKLMKEDCYPRFLKSQIYKTCLEKMSDERKSFSQTTRRIKYLRRFPFYNGLKTNSDKTWQNPSPSGRRATAGSMDYHHRFVSANNLNYTSKSSTSPYYQRKGSAPDDYPIRKAGSLSSLVVSSSSLTCHSEDDTISTDSGIAVSRSRPGSFRRAFATLSLKKKMLHH